MNREIKVSVKDNAVVISQRADATHEYTNVTSLHKGYLYNAVLFSMADEFRQIVCDGLATLRIAKDRATEPEVVSAIQEEIDALSVFYNKVKDKYVSLKEQVTQPAA